MQYRASYTNAYGKSYYCRQHTFSIRKFFLQNWRFLYNWQWQVAQVYRRRRCVSNTKMVTRTYHSVPLHLHWNFSQDCHKITYAKFQGNMFSSSSADACGQTDMMKQIDPFGDYAHAPKIRLTARTCVLRNKC